MPLFANFKVAICKVFSFKCHQMPTLWVGEGRWLTKVSAFDGESLTHD